MQMSLAGILESLLKECHSNDHIRFIEYLTLELLLLEIMRIVARCGLCGRTSCAYRMCNT